jgi:hypothetical protein
VGSNSNCTIVIHLDIYRKGGKKITKRLLVKKGNVEQIGPDLSMDSGDENTVITELRWINTMFDFEKLAVVFWNHGSGDVNPIVGKIFNPAYLFHYNPNTNLLELDRSITFLDFIDKLLGDYDGLESQRGVCFDDSTKNYLDDTKLIKALNTFCMEDRKGKKIDLVCFDACLMAGIGTQCIMHNFAHYMVASEEVELGIGYPYDLILAPFIKGDLDPESFAKHIVNSYQNFYSRLTEDFTHSGIDLSKFSTLNENINTVSTLLIQALQQQRNKSVTNYLNKCYKETVKFEERTYVDIGHLWAQMLSNIHLIKPSSNKELINNLTHALQEGLDLISHVVIANVTGKNLAKAQGISIYFPQKNAYPSYCTTQFAKTNQWYTFLTHYLA